MLQWIVCVWKPSVACFTVSYIFRLLYISLNNLSKGEVYKSLTLLQNVVIVNYYQRMLEYPSKTVQVINSTSEWLLTWIQS
jgi:hypothetical protein